ncbi:MAG: hypothetical protein DI589_21670 [Shinella sp.]|nr:MAG: hypothetical protein DI589_21670 [Shinella sp.]
MKNFPIRDHLAELVTAAGLSIDDLGGSSGSPERVVRLVLDGKAKLPLDKVADVAVMLDCDAQALFRVALAQFYSADTVALLERMLRPQAKSAGEEVWVSFVRSVAPDDVLPPDRFARRLLRTLLKRAASGSVVE